jgi:hypothetical protein
MAFCKSCGTEIGEAKFCPACGSAQDVTPVQETVSAPVYTESVNTEPVSAPVYAPASTYSSTGDTSGTSSTEIPPVYSAPVYSTGSFEKPSTTGSMVFSIINIALGVLLCCCYGVSLISLVLGIIALVFTNQAGKASTTEEAQQKLKTAKIMNIIGVAFLALAVIITIIAVAIGGTTTWTDILDNNGYSYSY